MVNPEQAPDSGPPADIYSSATRHSRGYIIAAAFYEVTGAGAKPPTVRESFVQILAECATLDGKVKPLEAELLAAMAAHLGVPVLPLDMSKLSRTEYWYSPCITGTTGVRAPALIQLTG